jgi:hypothetical protein
MEWLLRGILAIVVTLTTPSIAAISPVFTPQARIGHLAGDQWEPAIAADGYGHVYILYPQYLTVPGCASCPVPTMMLAISSDNGTTWEAPREIAPLRSAQFDPQIVVDSLDRRAVYAAWLQSNKTDIIVARSFDFGRTWAPVLASRTPTGSDKPVLTVRGPDVYVAYNHEAKLWVAVSHDGGFSYTTMRVNGVAVVGWAQAGGATIDPAGNTYIAWASYSGGQGPVSLNISKSLDGGRNWRTVRLDISAAPPECEKEECGWAYLGPQITMASDEAGTLYALWNSGLRTLGPERVYFSSSTTSAATWSAKADISSVGADVTQAFPAIVAGTAGDVRIAWMDTRNKPLWNTYYRSSTNGGATWSSETQLSSYVPGYSYIEPPGFKFPFGDYFEMGIDNHGDTQVVWGEGLTYESPGSIWHTHGR